MTVEEMRELKTHEIRVILLKDSDLFVLVGWKMTGGPTLTDRVGRMESVIEGIIRIMGTDDENHNLYQMVTEMRSSLRGHTAQLAEMNQRVSATAGSSSSSSFAEITTDVEGLQQDVLALRRVVDEMASRSLVDVCTASVESLAEEVAVLKRSVAAAPLPTTEGRLVQM